MLMYTQHQNFWHVKPVSNKANANIPNWVNRMLQESMGSKADDLMMQQLYHCQVQSPPINYWHGRIVTRSQPCYLQIWCTKPHPYSHPTHPQQMLWACEKYAAKEPLPQWAHVMSMAVSWGMLLGSSLISAWWYLRKELSMLLALVEVVSSWLPVVQVMDSTKLIFTDVDDRGRFSYDCKWWQMQAKNRRVNLDKAIWAKMLAMIYQRQASKHKWFWWQEKNIPQMNQLQMILFFQYC